jgi:hypothetical protein
MVSRSAILVAKVEDDKLQSEPKLPLLQTHEAEQNGSLERHESTAWPF